MIKRHTYHQAEKFILSREFFGMKLGLENITEFMARIGNPQDKFGTVHVAGTNGKGSTVVMIASMLEAAGYRVGRFTSPHLVSFRERVSVNGDQIPKRSIISFVDRYRKILVKKNSRFLS